jgi:chemotaxis protein methyltransferase WspC
VFYLLGLMNDAAGDISHASDFYRKAVYLESDHYEALAQLSLLAKKSGDAAAARQWSQRAQRAHEKLAAKTHGRSHSKT